MNGRRKRLIVMLTSSAVTVVLGLSGIVIANRLTRPAGGGEIFLENTASAGSHPFTPSVAPPPSTPPPTPAPPSPPPGGPVAVQAASGSTPGLYGGTQNVGTCNSQQLVSFLAADPSKAAAWAGALDSDPNLRWSQGGPIRVDQIGTYVSELTPVVLRADTRVTNHGYFNGRATSFQSVLQAGTAVLVDKYGVPRVRCACGNPLIQPVAVTTYPVYRGYVWPSFSQTTIVVVRPPPTVINIFVLVDPRTRRPFVRPVGTLGTSDAPAPPGTVVIDPAAGQSPTPSPTAAASPTPSAIQSPTRSPSAGQSPTLSPSASQSPTPSPSAGQSSAPARAGTRPTTPAPAASQPTPSPAASQPASPPAASP